MPRVKRPWSTDPLLQRYHEQIDRYKCTSEMAERIFSRVIAGEKFDFHGQLHEFKANMATAQERFVNRAVDAVVDQVASKHGFTLEDLLGDDTYRKKAAVIEENEVQLRLGLEFPAFYEDMINNALVALQMSDSKTHSLILQAREQRIGWLNRVLPFGDRMFIPTYDRVVSASSRNRAGFYRTEIVLPRLVEGQTLGADDAELDRIVVFSKFFGKEHDCLKSNAVTNYVVGRGLPFPGILATSKDASGLYLSSSNFVEGQELTHFLSKDRLDYDSNVDVLKEAVDVLAKIHVVGGQGYEEHFAREWKRGMNLDMDDYFKHKFVGRKLGLSDGTEPDLDLLASMHDKLMRELPDYEQVYNVLKREILPFLEETEISRTARYGPSFLQGDAHPGNFMRGKDITVIDPEMACIGLAEFDLYKLIEDSRVLVALGDRYQDAKQELLTQYTIMEAEARCEVISENELARRVEQRIEVYNHMRCLMDFANHAMYREYMLDGERFPDDAKRREFSNMQSVYYDRAHSFVQLVVQGIDEVRK